MTEPAPTAPTALRADARRNLEQILRAASSVFGEQGYDVAMEEVARVAGVGVGTLYRRFPDREALVVAVVEHTIRSLLERVRTATAEEDRAWDALVASMSYSRDLRTSFRMEYALPAATRQAIAASPEIRDVQRQLVTTLTTLVERAQAEGSLRTDVGTGDVLQLFALVYNSAKAASGGPAELPAQRALAVILDGLSTRDHAPLPGRPLQPEDLRRPSAAHEDHRP